jgi:hypothetical protein
LKAQREFSMNKNQHKCLWVTATGLFALVAGGLADEGVQLVQTTRNIPERGAVRSVQVEANARKLSFIVPPAWRIGASQTEKKVVLQTRDFGATVEVRMGAWVDVAGADLRAQVLGRLASPARIVKEYEWPTPLGRAVVFETEQAPAQNLRILTRSVFVAQDSGWVQLNLTTQPDKDNRHQKAFENLIASFRSE